MKTLARSAQLIGATLAAVIAPALRAAEAEAGGLNTLAGLRAAGATVGAGVRETTGPAEEVKAGPDGSIVLEFDAPAHSVRRIELRPAAPGQ